MTVDGNIQAKSRLELIKVRHPDQFSVPDPVMPQRLSAEPRRETAVDVLLVNPPVPESRPRGNSNPPFGRNWPKEMIWPQVSLAQMAAMLAPDYEVAVVDAAAQHLSWTAFKAILHEKQPRYYLTLVRASTTQNDMFGVSLAHGIGAKTMAFGPYITRTAYETMDLYPSLDFVLRGESELTLRELVDLLEVAAGSWPETMAESKTRTWLQKIFQATSPHWQPAWRVSRDLDDQLSQVQGMAWRSKGKIVVNPDRPFIPNLDDMPLPHHQLLPLSYYRLPLFKGPCASVVTCRDNLAGHCRGPQFNDDPGPVRLRSPENIMAELWLLYDLGIHNVHMTPDVFTSNREQVMGLAKMIIEEELPLRWTCNTYVDQVDEEMLILLGRAGCWLILWGFDSTLEQPFNSTNNGHHLPQTTQALHWAKKAGIKNWGYFTLGLPGETEESIQRTIAISKELPLDLAFFQLDSSYYDSPFFFDRIENGWLQATHHRESVSLGQVIESGNGRLKVEQLEYWQKRAFREWALRPGPIWTMLKDLSSWAHYRNVIDLVFNP
jgi:anaerobic magnesium-protoporphyrin IX monomethyl ester cyclase